MVGLSQKTHAMINPKFLNWARTTLGYNIEEAAKKIGIKTKKLENAENGIEFLTINQLIKVSEVYKRPIAAFYLKKIPKDISIPDFRLINTQNRNPLSALTKIGIRKIYEYKKNANELVKSEIKLKLKGKFDINSDPEIVTQKIQKDLEIDYDALKEMKNSKEAFYYWRNLIENQNILVFQLERIDLDQFRGFIFSEEPFPTISLNSKDSYNGKIFTLLHEFCHILLNEDSICIPNQFLNITNLNNAEIFCNSVAGELLVPKTLLLSQNLFQNHGNILEWSREELEKLSKIFKVSQEVILRRLLTLGKTSSHFYNEMRNYWKNQKFSIKKEGRGNYYINYISHTSPKYLNIVLDAFETKNVSTYEAIKYLGLRKEKTFNEIYSRIR